MNPRAPAIDQAPGWWSDRRYLLLLVALCAAPLIWPSLPPLTDALGHLARYHVELALDTSPYLKRFFAFRWALVGNLGVDLLVVPLAPLLGLQLTVKLIAIAIPTMTAAGLLLIAREAHGRAPATAAFALPLAYGFPFQFGFLNYTLSMALALLAFALWLRLARAGRYRLRAALFLILAPLIWLAHVYGWGVLGLLCLAAEIAKDRAKGGRRVHLPWRAPLACLPLVPPLILMALWRSGSVAGMTGDWFNLTAKLAYFMAALRDRWFGFDVGSVLLLAGLILLALFRRGGLRLNPMLGIATLILALAYLLLPRILLGSAYADMRLVPYVLAIGIIAIRPKDGAGRVAPVLAVAALALFAARTAATTVNFIGYDRAYARQLAALEGVPRGSRILVLVSLPCQGAWVTTRMDHLGSQAIVRKDAFVNGQWVMPGAQLLQVTYKAAGRFATDPSQLLRPRACRGHGEPILEDTLRNFPRAAFDYLWLIDMPPDRWPRMPDLIPAWKGARGILYRVARPAPAPEAARP
ncbi:MAG: hypothetical protein ABW173_05870 [Sphingomonas sp.]